MRCSLLVVGLILATSAAAADVSDGVVRIGVLTDMNGVFSDTTGPGSVEAARMAAEDFSRERRDITVEIVHADHQNKPDIGSVIVRKWLDVDRVDAVVDVPNSAVGLAVNAITRGTRMTFLASSTATSELTGRSCSPNTVQWVNDTWAIGNSTAAAMMKRGGESWYFITVNYALGQSIEAEATAHVEKNGGKVLGASRHPLGTTDFSSFLLKAQGSGAKVIGLANAGADTVNAVKQAAEFGMRDGRQSLVAFLVFIDDIHAMGLQNARGLLLTESFYWDMNDDTRAFARRFATRPGMNGKMPSAGQAGVYSATLAYLRAVAAVGSDDAGEVVPQMKRTPLNDPLFGDLTVRPDGRAVHPIHLFEVKAPAESKQPWDYYRLIATIPAEQAFRPLADGGCPMAR